MADDHDYDGITYRKEGKHSPNVFRILFTLLVVWGIAYMGHYLFSGWSSKAEADAARKAREAKKQMALTVSQSRAGEPNHVVGNVAAYAARGKQLFAANCAACHGETAKGSVGPDLTLPHYKYGKSRAEIVQSIGDGRPGGMPAFKSQLDREQIESLTEFLLSLK